MHVAQESRSGAEGILRAAIAAKLDPILQISTQRRRTRSFRRQNGKANMEEEVWHFLEQNYQYFPRSMKTHLQNFAIHGRRIRNGACKASKQRSPPPLKSSPPSSALRTTLGKVNEMNSMTQFLETSTAMPPRRRGSPNILETVLHIYASVSECKPLRRASIMMGSYFLFSFIFKLLSSDYMTWNDVFWMMFGYVAKRYILFFTMLFFITFSVCDAFRQSNFIVTDSYFVHVGNASLKLISEHIMLSSL